MGVLALKYFKYISKEQRRRPEAQIN